MACDLSTTCQQSQRLVTDRHLGGWRSDSIDFNCIQLICISLIMKDSGILRSDSDSISKYQKFIGFHNSINKIEINLNAVGKMNCSVDKSCNMKNQRGCRKSLDFGFSPIRKVRDEPKKTMIPGTRAINETIAVLKNLLREIKNIIGNLNKEVERTVDNVLRYAKTEFITYFGSKMPVQEIDMKQIDNLVQKGSKRQFSTVMTESLSTQQDKGEEADLPTPKHNQTLKNQMKWKNQIKSSAEDPNIIKRNNFEKAWNRKVGTEQSDSRSYKFFDIGRKREHCGGRNASKEIEKLQKRIHSVKNLLD